MSLSWTLHHRGLLIHNVLLVPNFPVQLQQWPTCSWVDYWQDIWKHSFCMYLMLYLFFCRAFSLCIFLLGWSCYSIMILCVSVCKICIPSFILTEYELSVLKISNDRFCKPCDCNCFINRQCSAHGEGNILVHVRETDVYVKLSTFTKKDWLVFN